VVKFNGDYEMAAVSGSITDKSNGQPIAGAWSRIDGYFTGISDSSGNLLLHTPDASRKIITNKFGYYPDTTQITVFPDSNIEFSAALEPAPHEISFSDSIIDFDTLELQSAVRDTILISNDGFTVLNLEIISSLSSGFLVGSPQGTRLRPGDKVKLEIIFFPRDNKHYESTLIVNSEAGSDTVYLSGTGVSVGVPDNPDGLPVSIELSQNYPNPFNPSTTIRFDTPSEGFVNLSVYDVNGRLVETLLNGITPAGTHDIVWNAGQDNPSGIYFYTLKTAETVISKKLLLLK